MKRQAARTPRRQGSRMKAALRHPATVGSTRNPRVSPVFPLAPLRLCASALNPNSEVGGAAAGGARPSGRRDVRRLRVGRKHFSLRGFLRHEGRAPLAYPAIPAGSASEFGLNRVLPDWPQRGQKPVKPGFNVTEGVPTLCQVCQVPIQAWIGRTNRLAQSDQSRRSAGPSKAVRATEQGFKSGKEALRPG